MTEAKKEYRKIRWRRISLMSREWAGYDEITNLYCATIEVVDGGAKVWVETKTQTPDYFGNNTKKHFATLYDRKAAERWAEETYNIHSHF